MSNVLVLDIGSSSTRALLYDGRAQLIPGMIMRRSFSFHVDADGRSEEHAIEAFARVIEVLDELTTRAHLLGLPIDAMGISAFASSLVCLDDIGAPITPVYSYADTRFAQDARDLRGGLDEIAVLQRTGCRIRANYVPARIAWIKRTQPEVFSRTRWFASLSDYVCLGLFGVMRTGISVWSWSGLLNRQTLDWDGEWLSQLGISADQLPHIAGSDAWIGPMASRFTERWPALRNAACLPALGDGAAANVGSGCIDDRRIAVTIGTTAALRIVNTGRPAALPEALWGYRVDHARELIGGATTEGGSVFQWLLRTLRLPDGVVVEDQIAQMSPDAHGLTILPLFSGERSPGYSEDSRATLHGLSLDTEPVQIVRACLEAIAYRLCAIYDELRTCAQPGAQLIASGGALLASPAWCQIIADATGATLTVCDEPEATSRGIAMLVLERLGEVSLLTLAGATHHGRIFIPNPDGYTIYQSAIKRQQALYAKVV